MLEGIEVLRDLANQLDEAPHFRDEYDALEAEFKATPLPTITQSLGENATAGRDQYIHANVRTTSLSEYVSEHLHRLASKLFEDIADSASGRDTLLLLSGITTGGDDPVPSERVLGPLLSSIWRLAKKYNGGHLSVVLATTCVEGAAPPQPNECEHITLGPIRTDDAVVAIMNRVPHIEESAAQAVADATAAPGNNELSYTQLRERVASLEVNHIDKMRGHARNE